MEWSITMVVEYIQRTLLIAPPVLLALTVHEFSHAFVADKMGDPTARMLKGYFEPAQAP